MLKALEKERSRRYASANGLAADLRRYLDNEPIAARPPSKLYRVKKAWEPKPPRLSGRAGVVSALIVGFATSMFQRRIVERTARNLRESLYASEMNAAYHAWRESPVVQARQLVDKQWSGTDANQSAPRGFDWRYLWGLTRPVELFTLTNATTWGLALSPDGETFAGCTMSADRSVDHRLRLWSLAEKRVIATLDTNGTWIFSAAFSPDGRRLAVPHQRGRRPSNGAGLGRSEPPPSEGTSTQPPSSWYRVQPGRQAPGRQQRRDVFQ